MRIVDSPNQDERPPGTEISLVVLHSISLPPGEYAGDAIERLFTNCLDPQAHPYFREICGLQVSAHFLVRRDGSLVQFVPPERRAWHAGASSWRGRSRCNDFSIGIELEGSEDDAFESAQYAALASLLKKLQQHLPHPRCSGAQRRGARAQDRSRRALRLAAPARSARAVN